MKKLIPCTLLICLSLLVSPVLAQDRAAQTQLAAAAPTWLQIMVVRVKPESVREFEELQKNETLPALKKGGLKWRDAWTTASFGESFEYVFVQPIESIAQLDSPGALTRALGEEGVRAYLAKANRLVVSRRTFAAVYRPDMSYQGKLSGAPKLGVVNRWQVMPGRTAEFEAIIKNEAMPAFKKADVPFWVNQTAFGGDVNEYHSLTLQDSFTEISKGSPVIRAVGQEQYNRMLQKTAGIVVNLERSIIRFMPDLSFRAPQSPAQ